jgi:hypothetical protein
MWGAAGAMGQTITSLSPSSVPVRSGEWFLTANGRYIGDTFVYDGPAGTFVVEASVVETDHSTAWVPSEMLIKGGAYKLVVRGPNGSTDPVDFTITSPSRTVNLGLVLPEVLVAAARSTKGAYVKYDVTAFGGDDPEPVIKCVPESGAFFYTGSNRVACEVTNKLGESAKDEFSISVIDDPPIITAADVWSYPDSERGSYVKFDVSAFDEVDDKSVAVKCSQESGAFFPLGITTVECTAEDSVGNLNNAVFNIDVSYDKPAN